MDRLWAETTDTIINLASSLTHEELRKTLEYLKLNTEGDDMTMKWRLVSFHQNCRHMHETWEESGKRDLTAEIERLRVSRSLTTAPAPSTIGASVTTSRVQTTSFQTIYNTLVVTEALFTRTTSVGSVTFAWSLANVLKFSPLTHIPYLHILPHVVVL